MTTRRTVLATGAAGLAATSLPALAGTEGDAMYGMIGKITAQPGRRAELIRLLLAGAEAMPGCRSYIVAEDAADADAIWVSEAWDSEASHKASLALPQVRAAIAAARPLIAGFDTMAVTRPVGGVGLR